jgi:hypothetical protein
MLVADTRDCRHLLCRPRIRNRYGKCLRVYCRPLRVAMGAQILWIRGDGIFIAEFPGNLSYSL